MHAPLVQWTIPSNVEISPECRDLLTRMLVRDPEHRITMAQIQVGAFVAGQRQR